MKNERLNLAKLKVTSFVTNVITEHQETVKGGAVPPQKTVSDEFRCDTWNQCPSVNSYCPTGRYCEEEL